MAKDATRKGVSKAKATAKPKTIARTDEFEDWQDEVYASIVAKGEENRAKPDAVVQPEPKEPEEPKVRKYKTGIKARMTAAFLRAPQWIALRETVFAFYGRVCMRCGSTSNPQCDHIKPKSRYPELALAFTNLQVLCWCCNSAKGTKDETDYRPVGVAA